MKFRREKKPKEKQKEVTQVAETAAVATAEATWPQTRAILRVIIIILLVAVLMWGLYKLQGVLLLIILSIFFAYLVAPLVEFVHRPFKMRGREHVVPRTLAIGIVYLVAPRQSDQGLCQHSSKNDVAGRAGPRRAAE